MIPSHYRRWGKRACDIAAAVVLAGLVAPVVCVAAALIKLTSPGPVFFRQLRMGRGGKVFMLVKLRTMYETRDPNRRHGFEAGSRSRLTAVGRWLRAAKIDELPQLYNILRGEMSFVGPRPEVAAYRELYVTQYSEVLSVLPGLTDEASIRYRNEEHILASVPDPQRYYREVVLPDKLSLARAAVVRGCTLRGDVHIILRTVAAVVWSVVPRGRV